MSQTESSSSMVLYVHRDHDVGTLDGHLDFHTAPGLCPHSGLFPNWYTPFPLWDGKEKTTLF